MSERTSVGADSTEDAVPLRSEVDLPWVSWLRVLAITGVVTIHTAGYDVPPSGQRTTLPGTVATVLDLGARFAVPVFVMVSGAVLLDPQRYSGAGPFLRRRALRLLPPLVFWHLWYLVVFLHEEGLDYSARQLLMFTLTGQLYTALYFFWIVAGLALVSPLLIPFLRESSRRGVLVAGVALAALPALAQATVGVRGGTVYPVEVPSTAVNFQTAWTWWIPYLGLYLLGWGLRGVVVRRGMLAALSIGCASLAVEQVWQWRHADLVPILDRLSPPSYYAALSVLYSVSVYLVVQSVVRPRGALAVLARPRWAALGRKLGGATLGVFGLHLTVLLVLQRLVFHGQAALGSVPEMLARTALVLSITYAIVLVARRIPLARTVL